MLNYFGDLHTCLNKEVASKFDELKYNINSNMLGINFNFELQLKKNHMNVHGQKLVDVSTKASDFGPVASPSQNYTFKQK